MDTLTWMQLGNGDWQAKEYPLKLSRTVSHRGQHTWRLRVPHEPDASYPDGWSWRDATPRGVAHGPLEASELEAAIGLVERYRDSLVRRLPSLRLATPRSIDPDSPLPKHAQIANHYREQIASGELLAGDKLPSNREIAAYYGVNGKHTVQRAMDTLRSEGLIVIKSRGYTRAGKFVTTNRPTSTQLTVPLDVDTDTMRAWVQEQLGITVTPYQADIMRAYLNRNPNRGSL